MQWCTVVYSAGQSPVQLPQWDSVGMCGGVQLNIVLVSGYLKVGYSWVKCLSVPCAVVCSWVSAVKYSVQYLSFEFSKTVQW